MKKTLANIVLFFVAVSSLAQNHYDHWFLGRNMGLDLTTSPASVVTGLNGVAQEATTSMTDAVGNLLFYTNSDTIFDSSHQPMPNGSHLIGGGHSSYQGVIAFANPGNPNQYYVVSVGDASGYTPTPSNWLPPYGGLAYHVLDMTENGGFGDVVLRDQVLDQILDSNPEKWYEQRITAAPHCNGRDIWFVVRKQQSVSSVPCFFAYRVSPSGISAPVISTVGLPGKGFGAMKFSPDGSKLAITGSKIAPATGIMDPAYIEVFDFDPSTGVFSTFNRYEGGSILNLGLSFSPNNRFLYFLASGLGTVNGTYQIDLTNPDMLTNTVQISIAVGNSMQMGSDSIIYINTNPTFSIIEEPNQLGMACTYQSAFISPPAGSMWTGICNTMDAIPRLEQHVADFDVVVPNPCDSLSVSFFNTSSPSSLAYAWNFDGIGASVAENPTFTFPAQGAYMVELVVSNSECGADTIRKMVHIGESTSSITLLNDTICFGDTLLFADYTIASSGTYTDSLLNNLGCDSLVVFDVVVDSIMAEFDYILSSPYPPATIDLINLGDTSYSHTWSLNAEFSSAEFNESIELNNSGEYIITLETSNENCTAIHTATITMLQHDIVIPNVFTPNGDGVNDLFTFDNYGYTVETVQIYNRWGMEVTSDHNNVILWNGHNKSGDAVPEGVYYYSLLVKDIEGKSSEWTGYVQLNR